MAHIFELFNANTVNGLKVVELKFPPSFFFFQCRAIAMSANQRCNVSFLSQYGGCVPVSISFAPLWVGFIFTNSDTIYQWFLWCVAYFSHIQRQKVKKPFSHFSFFFSSHFILLLLKNILLMLCNPYICCGVNANWAWKGREKIWNKVMYIYTILCRCVMWRKNQCHWHFAL